VPSRSLYANVVDIIGRTILACEIKISGTRIESIKPLSDRVDESLPYAFPGFIDAHIHIESSMLIPSEFARLASVHGTVATVSDPHEIANVMGIEGIEFMLESAKTVPLKFCFGAPSCVPATSFETSGASLDADAVAALLARPDIGYLAEMMNYPGVLLNDPEVLAKIESARDLGKPVDGHAPGLVGNQAMTYANAGISTDHECTEFEEALQKIEFGMKILIREGSAAKNYEALKSLIDFHPDCVMLCSDDKHPDELADGHLNILVSRAVQDGLDLFNVLRAACLNPIDHYSLPVGKLRVGDPADFVIVSDLVEFNVLQTFINGKCIAENGKANFDATCSRTINQFDCEPKQATDFNLKSNRMSSNTNVRVIETFDGELISGELRTELWANEVGLIQSDVKRDILKIAVVNRYRQSPVAVAFIRGFGLTQGAIASSVGHDSHNILAVGVDDESLCAAINEVINHCGGIAAIKGDTVRSLPLPIGGIMSDKDGYWVAKEYRAVDAFSKQTLGSTLSAPFMTLSFMGLLVIPKLKLSDLGLFDGEHFKFVSVECSSPDLENENNAK